MSLTALSASVLRVAEEHGAPTIHPILVGVMVFIGLMALLFMLLAFAGGREHS